MKRKFRRGVIVELFEDPTSRVHTRGKAELLTGPLFTAGSVEYWRVRLLDTGAEGVGQIDTKKTEVLGFNEALARRNQLQVTVLWPAKPERNWNLN